jgi:hypothetical protein
MIGHATRPLLRSSLLGCVRVGVAGAAGALQLLKGDTMATGRTTRNRAALGLALVGTLVPAAPAHGATAYRLEASQGTLATTPGPATFASKPYLTARLLATVGGPGQEWTVSVQHGQSHGYRIRNRSSGQCLAIRQSNDAAMRADGTALVMQGCVLDWPNMTWRFYIGWPPRLVGGDSSYATSNLVTIMNVGTRKCIGIAPTATFVSGVLLRQYACGPDMRRRWRWRSVVVP